MQLSINNDIYFYGQLKTIGTTPKQIKSIVKKETLFYALLAIPMGLVFASLFSYFFSTLYTSAINIGISY